MSPNLEKKLIQKYPNLLNKDPKSLHPYDMFGIEFGDGWYDLVDVLLDEISKYYAYYNITGIKVLQLKEKFGGLRCYLNSSDEYVNGAISVIEDLSFRICEDCGSNKNIGHTTGYIRTVCEDCALKNNAKNWIKDQN